MPIREHSAGGVVVRDGEVLLVRAKNLKGEPVWVFPKGLIEEKETPREAAVREVLEETGYEAEILRPLGSTTYWFVRDGRRVKKTVDWFLMRPVQKVKDHDLEVDEVAWVPFGEALERLSYKSDRELLRRAMEALGAG
jgi:8-oxo-dGTP diphosphatase